MVKPSSLQAFVHRPALVRSKCGFENRIKNTFFIRSVSAYRELLIAAVLVVTIVQHRTSVLDKTACVCSKTSRVEHTKSVHNRPKPAVFVRTVLGLPSNQNEVAINSKSGLWRTALLRHIFFHFRFKERNNINSLQKKNILPKVWGAWPPWPPWLRHWVSWTPATGTSSRQGLDKRITYPCKW